jgi:hypothetical protein
MPAIYPSAQSYLRPEGVTPTLPQSSCLTQELQRNPRMIWLRCAANSPREPGLQSSQMRLCKLPICGNSLTFSQSNRHDQISPSSY